MMLGPRTPLIALLAAAGVAWTSALAQSQDGARIAMQICSGCHGAGGRSESPMFPKLNAQTSEYIEAQLKGFREHARGENSARDYMWGMAALLDAGAVKSLADYFSHQPATRGAAGDAALMARGQEIFERGVPDKGVPACASCHGAEAQGAGTFPRLAGQHKEYLLHQIEVFKNGTRGNAPVMSAVAHTLNDEQAKAVAVYLQSR
ncbi:cytochrome c4 [Burkholderia contaminans]|uniref:c-type cytochrome n=1 Tax=Burkholderia contaminans TaxID=488447 RepID=UPI001CF5B6F7|nr:c-type cytochrome [Burkholderia contaminans]MCA7919918.1 cytochrome c4 [Burkholderia contaminans]MCA8097879.1 cytochrome c4 [Burkholderia contaminans]UUX41013.1 cytochrome c4 [Burkholderia contaminans]